MRWQKKRKKKDVHQKGELACVLQLCLPLDKKDVAHPSLIDLCSECFNTRVPGHHKMLPGFLSLTSQRSAEAR